MSGSNCKGNARASHRKEDLCSTWVKQEQEMPQYQWWLTGEHLTLLGLCGLELLQYVLNLLLFSACWGTGCVLNFVWKSAISFGNTLKIPPLAFQCEHVPAYHMGLDKLVKWWRLTFAPGERGLYLEKLSDIRMIHLLLEANCLAFLQVKLNSCCWHENQGRQAE